MYIFSCKHTHTHMYMLQLNQFRLSVRQLLFNSSHTNHTSNHTQYQPSSSRLATHSQAPPTNSYRLSDGGGGGGDSYDIRVPPGMAAEGYVYPKQFAPKPTPRHYITYNSASNGYKTPPTPPVSAAYTIVHKIASISDACNVHFMTVNGSSKCAHTHTHTHTHTHHVHMHSCCFSLKCMF